MANRMDVQELRSVESIQGRSYVPLFYRYDIYGGDMQNYIEREAVKLSCQEMNASFFLNMAMLAMDGMGVG